MSKLHQKQINKYFPNKPIAYQPGLSIAFESVPVGLMLSQLLYWHEKGSSKDGWVYKTIEEMHKETGLSRTSQKTAIKICQQYGFLECKRKGIPAKRHFRLDMEKLEMLLPGLKEKTGIVYINPPRKFAENLQTTTKNTQETTSKNTQRHPHPRSTPSMGEIMQSDRYKFPKNSRNDGRMAL